MKFNQKTRVLMENGEIKEFTEGYISYTNLNAWNHNCTCELGKNEQCSNEDCYEDFDFSVTIFFDKDKDFQGVCINNESKDDLDMIGKFIHNVCANFDTCYPLLKMCNYEGIIYTIDLSDCEDFTSEDISTEFKSVFTKHKKAMLENHIEDFEDYYTGIFYNSFKKLRNEIYDFSTESVMLYEDLGNRHPNKAEYQYMSSELRNIVAGYIEHKALGY